MFIDSRSLMSSVPSYMWAVASDKSKSLKTTRNAVYFKVTLLLIAIGEQLLSSQTLFFGM